MKNLCRLILIAIGMITFTALYSCDEPSRPETNGQEVRRTVLVYMAARCDLGINGADDGDLKEMAKGASALRNGGTLLVYHATSGGRGILKQITPKGKIETLLDYGTLEPGTTLTPAHMRRVLADARNFGECDTLGTPDPMGLILWSHGTGWVDDTGTIPYTPETGKSTMLYSFGADTPDIYTRPQKMSLAALADALNGQDLEFIYFDCCYMGCVEVLYELRHATRRFVASTTELPYNGMPYHLNLKHFFAPGEADLVAAARTTVNYYDTISDPSQRFCTMAVVDATALDRLAEQTKLVMESAAPVPVNYQGHSYSRESYQTIFDMPLYIKDLAGGKIPAQWQAAYDEAVIYSAHTPRVFYIDLTPYTGLGCHIITSPSEAAFGNYSRYGWWRDVVNHNRNFITSTE